MNISFFPSVACGTTAAPPSKSMAHRALLCGALSGGSSIGNLSASEDIAATRRCLAKMGAAFSGKSGRIWVGGLDPFALQEDLVLDCGESGSTLRFLLPLCLLSGKKVTLTGTKRLPERPMEVYEDIVRQQGLLYEKTERGAAVRGPLRPGTFTVNGGISSQFISGMLFALPLLEGDSILTVTGKIESAPYIEMTRQMLAQFGIRIDKTAENGFRIPGRQRYCSRDLTIEGDYSNAAYLSAWNVTGGNAEITGLSRDTLQGDAVFLEYFDKIRQGAPTLDVSDCPDLAPVLFVLAGMCHGATFTGTRRLRFKESDRIAAMKEELSKCGIALIDGENEVILPEGRPHAPAERLCGHNDHRVVMALSLLCGRYGGTICGAEAVRKSFPDFFEKLRTLHIIYNQEK